MKKIIAIICALLLVAVSFSACAPAGKTLDQVKSAGKLVIATSPDFPPFENLGENNKVEGIEIDILNIVCEKLGVELVIETMDFDSVLAGVQAGKYDLGVSGISVTPTREKNTLFTTPYCLAAQAIVVVDGSSITSKADLKGKTVAVQTGTTAEEYCMQQGYTVQAYTANNDAATALTQGRVDAWVIDDLTAAEIVKTMTGVKVLNEAMTTEPYAFALCFGSETLRDAINKIIDSLISDGTIKGIFDNNDAPYTSPASAEK